MNYTVLLGLLVLLVVCYFKPFMKEGFIQKIPDLKTMEDYKRKMDSVKGHQDNTRTEAKYEEHKLTKEPANLDLYCSQYGCINN